MLIRAILVPITIVPITRICFISTLESLEINEYWHNLLSIRHPLGNYRLSPIISGLFGTMVQRSQKN